jgi:hypothetical protein
MGAAGALGTAQSVSASPTGQLGSSGDAVSAAFLAELDGPITDTGTPIDQLVNIRLVETGVTINPDPNTLVIRYNP